jgi:hypothetical protein
MLSLGVGVAGSSGCFEGLVGLALLRARNFEIDDVVDSVDVVLVLDGWVAPAPLFDGDGIEEALAGERALEIGGWGIRDMTVNTKMSSFRIGKQAFGLG